MRPMIALALALLVSPSLAEANSASCSSGSRPLSGTSSMQSSGTGCAVGITSGRLWCTAFGDAHCTITPSQPKVKEGVGPQKRGDTPFDEGYGDETED